MVQEAFMVALIKLDPERNPKAWLIQVVDHLSLNFQRKLVRRAKLVSKWSPTDAGVAAGTGIGETADTYDETADPRGGDD